MDANELKNYEKAGDIARDIRKFSEKLVVEGALLLDIAEKIEARIISLGGKPAFPVNLSLNDVAAHQIPAVAEKTKLEKGDLIKVDFGVHVNGYIVDTAYSVSIGKSDENEKLIIAANEALDAALAKAKPKTKVSEIGKVICASIEKHSFNPIRNLSGHMVAKYELHAGTTIPNYDNEDDTQISEGQVFAIEPFSTTGVGMVEEGKPSEIYRLIGSGAVRSGREILDYIKTEYQTLPFAKRWLIKKFGAIKTNIAIKELLSKKILKEYGQLVEKSGGKVAQAEHTVIVKEKPVVLTKI